LRPAYPGKTTQEECKMLMRFQIYTVAMPILAAVAFAQDTPPVQPKQPAENAAPSKAGSDRSSQEVKTQTYSGILMDASCAGAGSAAATTSTSSTGTSADSTASTSSADRSAGSGSNPSCGVATSTTQFALKTKDGNTVRFDDVGNARVQEAMKTHKKWSDSASASKPIHVKANGVLNGDKLTVLSID
jgi:hypothetical protein